MFSAKSQNYILENCEGYAKCEYKSCFKKTLHHLWIYNLNLSLVLRQHSFKVNVQLMKQITIIKFIWKKNLKFLKKGWVSVLVDVLPIKLCCQSTNKMVVDFLPFWFFTVLSSRVDNIKWFLNTKGFRN